MRDGICNVDDGCGVATLSRNCALSRSGPAFVSTVILKEKKSILPVQRHKIVLFAFNCFTSTLVKLVQMLDSGHRVPRDPSFFLGYKHEEVAPIF